MAQEIANRDPHGAHYFALEINHTEVAHFQQFSGLKTTSEVFEISEGGVNGYTHKRPGPARYDNVVLRYATNASMALLEWRDKYLRGDYRDQPTDSGAVVIYANNGEEVRRFSFTRVWPVSWEGPELSAASSQIAVETVEIAFDGLFVS